MVHLVDKYACTFPQGINVVQAHHTQLETTRNGIHLLHFIVEDLEHIVGHVEFVHTAVHEVHGDTVTRAPSMNIRHHCLVLENVHEGE